jgi:hypothetical protein
MSGVSREQPLIQQPWFCFTKMKSCFVLLQVFFFLSALAAAKKWSFVEEADDFKMPLPIEYLPRRIHPCFEKFSKNSTILVTSFNEKWFNHMLEINKEEKPEWDRTILKTTFDYPLIVYHEEDLPDITAVLPTACLVDLRVEYPWLDNELINPTSGLNRYYKIASFSDPCFVAKKGYTKPGHVLMLKVSAINHAVQSVADGTLVFWVDTDVEFREPFPPAVEEWLHNRDVTYIPFFLGKDQRLDTSLPGGTEAILKSDERWRRETGLFAITVSERTRVFTQKALSLYRGGMYELAKRCYAFEDFCLKQTRVKYNVFLNDIFVFGLLIHSDLVKDHSLFYVGLRHGVFAFAGLPPWGPHNAVWGVRAFIPLFMPKPAEENNDIVTNFHIGKYIFHFFGFSDRGVYSVQSRHLAPTAYNASSWRKIDDPGPDSGPDSLISVLEVPYMG